MPGLAREGLEILHRARIGRHHLQYLSRFEVRKGLLRAQDRQRAIQAARVQFLVESHGPHSIRCGAMEGWLITIAQLPIEDPAARMRVLRTLESLGAAVMREGAYLLPDNPTNRQALEALGEYIGKSAGNAQVLQVNAISPAQHDSLRRLFDRSARYDALIKTVESLRVGFGQADPSAISRVLHKQRREFEAIAALDFFPTEARSRAENALFETDT